MNLTELALRYGTNPHQTPARVFMAQGKLPLNVVQGAPGYINLLDALNAWQLVRELKQATGLAAAASFKHVSPAGAAVAVPLSDTLRQSYAAGDMDLSPLATAYVRARGADRQASFGDFAALSDIVDVAAAQVLRREVSDGVIAPGFTPEAAAILQKKQGGKYLMLEMDPNYMPPSTETREVYGVSFQQTRNETPITNAFLQERVTRTKDLSAEAERDLLVALISIKYTQSNSVGLAVDGQMIGIGAGQQSRILCTRLACGKADQWYLRQHPKVRNLPFREKLSRTDRDNGIDLYLLETLSQAEEAAWLPLFERAPERLTPEDKAEWLDKFNGVSLGSDGFIPFRDNVDRASQSGISYIAQPGHSVRDEEIIAACDEYGMTMAFTGLRLFHH